MIFVLYSNGPGLYWMNSNIFVEDTTFTWTGGILVTLSTQLRKFSLFLASAMALEPPAVSVESAVRLRLHLHLG